MFPEKTGTFVVPTIIRFFSVFLGLIRGGGSGGWGVSHYLGLGYFQAL